MVDRIEILTDLTIRAFNGSAQDGFLILTIVNFDPSASFLLALFKLSF